MEDILKTQQEIASVAAAASRLKLTRGADDAGALCADPVETLLDPARMWAYACGQLLKGEPDEGAIALGIRAAAAKVKAGDRAFVYETLVGQSLWLGALAIKLAKNAEERGSRKEALVTLAMRAQAASAKALLSAAAMEQIAHGGVSVE